MNRTERLLDDYSIYDGSDTSDETVYSAMALKFKEICIGETPYIKIRGRQTRLFHAIRVSARDATLPAASVFVPSEAPPSLSFPPSPGNQTETHISPKR